MLFEKLADAHLNAGWLSIQKSIHLLLSQPSSAVELLKAMYASLDEMQQKLYLYSPQLVARVDEHDQLDAALLFEPPRVPDHRQGLEDGLRVLLTWLVEQGRTEEARGWAQLSRILTEHLSDLDYLDKGAQVSLFCIGDRTSRYYLNLQALENAKRLELLTQCEASELYEKVYQIASHSSLSLGGVGIEMLPGRFRTKLYVRGSLSTLVEETRRVLATSEIPEFDSLGCGGFIRSSMEAEAAFETDSQGNLRTKWVYFVDRAELGLRCAENWLSEGPHWARLKEVIACLGGTKSLFALGAESNGKREGPKRVNIYARKARDL